MIESGRVVAIETDALWVETRHKTTCGNCAAQKGCGQSLLQQLYPARSNHLRVLLTGGDAGMEHSYQLGDSVEFSLSDHTIVMGSLLVYLVPIIGLLLGGLLGAHWFAHELAIIVTAFSGFAIAAAGVRLYSTEYSHAATLQAQLVARVQGSSVLTPAQQQANFI